MIKTAVLAQYKNSSQLNEYKIQVNQKGNAEKSTLTRPRFRQLRNIELKRDHAIPRSI